jgi:hypothetical protein
MPTLQPSRGLRDRIRGRLGTGALALSALCAVGLAVLTLTSAGHKANKAISPIGAAQTHVAPAAVATPAPAGYFRDPGTHALLRVRATGSGAGSLPANHSRGRILR